MIPTTRASLTTKIAVSLACIAGAALMPLTVAASAAATVASQHESFTEYQHQLAAGQIQAAKINRRLRSVHLTLKDGRHMLAKYLAHEEPKVLAELQAKGVPVTVEKQTEAAKEAAKPVHHKLRYIAGGILVVVVIVVGGVLFIDRKRKTEAD